MYEAPISRSRPACIVFLVDRSASMAERFGADGELSLAQGAANALNNILFELCLRSQKEPGRPPRHYFDVGVFGYGQSAKARSEAVEPALAGPLQERTIVPIPEVATHPLAIREMRRSEDLPLSKMPVWLDPVAGFGTPMCQAIATAGSSLRDWVSAHPDSFPPIVINISDGEVTDSPYRGADLREWAQRLTTLATSDGNVLLFNVFLSSRQAPISFFPADGAHLPRPGGDLFAISSPLPPPMQRQAEASGFRVADGARGLVFNADLASLSSFLVIGTRLSVNDR
jgi:hypothetical protein